MSVHNNESNQNQENNQLDPGQGNPQTGGPERSRNDYFGLKLFGVNDREIKFMQGDDPAMDINMMPEKEAYAKYAPMLAEKGMKTSPEQFHQQYVQAQSGFANYKKGQFDLGSFSEPIYRRTDRSFAADAHARQPLSSMDFESHAFNPKDTRFKVVDDKIVRLQTNSQYADQRGVYNTITGPINDFVESFTGVKDEAARKRNFTEVEIAGRKQMMGDLTKDLPHFEGVFNFRPGPEDETTLVMSQDEEGLPIWSEVNIRDEVIKGEVRSKFGPQQMYSTWYGNLFDSLLVNTIGSLPSASVGFVDWLNDGADYLNDSMFGTSALKESDVIDEGDTYWRNISNWATVDAPNDIADQSIFDSANSFWWSGGAALGSVAQMVLSRNIGSSVGKVVGLSDEAAASAGAYFGSGTMAITAANSFKNSMIQNGISEENQFLLYGAALVGSFAIERMGSNILDDGLSQFFRKQDLDNVLTKYVSEGMKAEGVSMAKEMTEEQAKNIGKNVWQRVLSDSKSLGGKAVTGTRKGLDFLYERSPIAFKAAYEEGKEEVIEGLYLQSLETVHDWGQTYFNKFKGEVDQNEYVADTDGSFYQVNKLSGTRRRVSEETYNKSIEAQEIKPGQGMFAEYNGSQNILSNAYNKLDASDMASDFVLGSFAGGLVGSIQNMRNGMATSKANTIQDLITSGREGELYGQLAQMHKEGKMGPTDVTQEGVPMTEAGEGAKSMNDIAYDSAIEQINATKEIWNKARINKEFVPGATLNYLTSNPEGKDILREAYSNMSTQVDLQTKLGELEVSFIEAKDDSERASIEKQINDIKIQKKDLVLQLDDIRSGDRVKENIANKTLRQSYDAGSSSIENPDGSSRQVMASDVKNMNERYVAQKEQAVVQAKEADQKRGKLENEAGTLASAIKSTKTDYTNTEGMSALADELSVLQKKSAEVGLSEAGAKNLIDSLEDKRKEIIKNVESYFTEEEVGDIKTTYGEMADETLQERMATAPEGSPAASAYQWSKSIEQSIKSFKVEEAKTLETGDMAQWSIDGENKFDKPRKIEEIHTAEDGKKYAKIEGSETPIPLEQLHDPAFEGKVIKGSVPNGFNESQFVEGFYDRYIDTQGNDVSISKTLEDLSSRTLNEEDMITLHNLQNAISNNNSMLDSNMQLFGVGKEINLGKYTPTKDTQLTKAQITAVKRNFFDKENLINDLLVKQGKDVANKQNLESKHRMEDYQIRNYIIDIFSGNSHLSVEQAQTLRKLKEDIDNSIDESFNVFEEEGFFNRTSVDSVDPLLVEAESYMSEILNSAIGEKVAKEIFEFYKKSRGYGDKKSMNSYSEANEFTISDFKNTYTFEGFKASAGNSPLAVAQRQFGNIYISNHLQKLKRMDPLVFYKQLGSQISDIETDNGILPSFEQIQNIYHTVAFMSSPDNSLLMIAETVFTGKNPSEDSHLKNKIRNRSLFVRGFAGTGKTSTVLKIATSIYAGITGGKVNILISAPSVQLQSQIVSNMASFRKNRNETGMSYNELIQYVSDPKSGISNADLIVVDEASSLSDVELDDFQQALRNANTKANLTVIYLGDQSQMTDVNQKENAHLPAERTMERTMPTTTVYRSGSSDIANLQNAYRNAIFQKKKIMLPKGTYDQDRNNGLEYFGGTKKEMYDRFIDDINNGDDVKRNETVLIVYKLADREAALNYIKKGIDNQNIDIASKIKTMEKGDSYVQGLEFPRIYVAIEEADATHLYSKAMLTAMSRASKFDDDHNGYAIAMSDSGYSSAGVPIVVSTQTASSEDVNRMKSWIGSIVGQEFNPELSEKNDVNQAMSEVTLEAFNNFKGNIRSINTPGKISFSNDGIDVNGQTYRYTIKNKGVLSVTERLVENIKKSGVEKPRTNQAHALRGTIIHSIVEHYINKQQKTGGKLFTKADISALLNLISQYNNEADSWNQENDSKLNQLNVTTNPTVFENDPWIQEIIDNVAAPIASYLNGNGKFAIPETVIGIYYNDIAGTIDIIDQVGVENGIPVVDILDIKSLTPGASRYFGDSNIESKLDLGVIEMPSGVSLAGNGLNKALSQLGTYKAILENGDNATGLKPVKVRNAVIIKSVLSNENTPSALKDSDFVKYDTEGPEFADFKQYGIDVVGEGIIPAQKDVRTYINDHKYLGQMFENLPESDKDSEGHYGEVTGVFKTSKGVFVEVNIENDPISIEQFEQNYVSYEAEPSDMDKTPESIYNRSALRFANGESFTFGNTSIEVQEGKRNSDNDHSKFKAAWLKSLGNKIKNAPSAPKIDVVFHPSIELLNDSGKLERFSNVLLATINDSTIEQMIPWVKKNYEWATGSNAQIANEIKSRGYHIMGSMPSPEVGFNKPSEAIDYSSQSEVDKLMIDIEKGFNESDPSYRELVAWNKHLAALRAMGAKSDNGFVTTTILRAIEKGSVKYGSNETSIEDLIKTLESKGFTVERPHWNSNAYVQTKDDGTKSKVASWKMNAWKIGKNTDKSSIYLRSKKWDGESVAEMKKELSELSENKSALHKDVNSTLAYMFIQQNRTMLIDGTTGEISSELPGLDLLLKATNKTKLDLNLSDKVTVKKLISTMNATINLLDQMRKDKNSIAKNLRNAIPFTTGDNKTLVIPKGKENQLFTGAYDIFNFGLYLDTTTVEISGDIQSSESNDDLKQVREIFGRFGIEDQGNHEMADIDENEFAKDDSIETAGTSDVSVEGKNNYFSFGQKYFGDIRTLNNIKRDLTNVFIQNSNYNKGIKAGQDRSYTFNESILLSMSMMRRAANSVDTRLSDVNGPNMEYKDMSEISGESFIYLNSQQKLDYAIYALGKDPDFLEAVFQKMFPNMDIKTGKMRDLANDIAEKLEGDQDYEVLNEKSQTSVMDNIEERDYTETLSAVVRMHLDGMQLRQYDLRGGYNVTGRRVDPSTIQKVMIDAAQLSNWETDETEGLNKFERWIRNLEDIALNAGIGTDTYNNIMTLYDNFFSENPNEMSHKYLADNSILGEPGLADSRVNDSNLVKVKGKASDLLISAIYNHFASVSSKVSIDIQTNGRNSKKKYRQKVQTLAIGSHIAQSIKTRINNKLFGINEDGIVVSKKIKDKIDGPAKVYDIKTNGVFDASGKSLIKFGKDKSGAVVSFELNPSLRAEDVKKMLNVFELKELVYNKTLDIYLGNSNDSRENSDEKVDREKLGEIVGMIMATAKLAVDPTWAGKEMVDAYYEANGYTKDTLDSLNDDSTMELDEVGSEMYKPSDLYRLIQNLSKVQSDVQLSNNSRHFYTVDGKKIFRDTNGSTIHQMFGTGDAGTQKASAGIKNEFAKQVAEFQADPNSARYQPLIDDKGNVLNTIADPNSNHDIEDMVISGGIKSEYKGSRQGKTMTDLDLANMMINGLFVEDLMANKKIQKVRIPYHNTANKANLPIFNHKFSDKRVFNVTEDGISIDKKWRDDQVINIFNYHNHARITSIRKWADVISSFVDNGLLLDVKSKSIRLNAPVNEDEWASNPEAMQAFISEMHNKSINFSELIRNNPLLIENKDYIMKDGLAYVGNAVLMNVDRVYNFNNMQKIKVAFAEDKLTEKIDELFRQRNYDSVKYLSDINFQLNPRIKNTSKWKLETEKGKEGSADKNKWSINPTLEAFLYAYHFADHYTSQLVQGDVTQYKGIEDVFKRSTGPVAPRYVPNTATRRGMGKTSRIAVFEDVNGEGYEQLETIFGKNGSYKETDGIGFINPISYILMRNSFGGRELGVMGDGMIKPIYFKNDLKTNNARYLKYALLNLTEQTLKNSFLARDTFRKMVGDELYGMWESGMSMDEIADYVIENNLAGNLIDQAVFSSAVKTGQSGVQAYANPTWNVSFEIDNDYFGIQLNPTQDVERTDLSLPTQLMGMIGIGDQNAERIQEINSIRAEVSKEGLENVMDNFTENGIFKKKLFFDYLRKMGIESALKNGEVAQMAEMLENRNMNMNLPSLGKVKQQLINKLTSEAIKPKWNGVRMSQAPGLFFRIFKDAEGGVYMENEVQKYGVPVIDENGSTLQPMKFYSDAEFTKEITSREEFDQLVEQDAVFVRPADIIMPFSYFKQFGLKRYADVNPDFSLNDVFMFETAEGLVSIKNMDDESLINFLQTEYNAMSQVKKEEAEVEGKSYGTFIQNEFKSPTAALEFIQNFKESLKVINNRVPTSSSSGAFIGNVVGWINDNGNTVYTSAAKNILDGGDYDIDQLNIYFKSIDKEGRIIADGKKGKMNTMFERTYEYYQDPKNAELYMSPIDLGSDKEGQESGIRGAVGELKKGLKKFRGQQNDWGTNLFYYDMIQQGDKLIGVFANIIKNYSYLAQVSAKNPSVLTGIKVDPKGVSEVGTFIIDTLESYMNSATDNAKELALGILGATEDAGNIIGAGSIKGMTIEQMVGLLKNKSVQEVFKKMQYSKRSDNAAVLNVFDAIDNEIKSLQEGAVEFQSKLEDRRKELQVLLSDPEAIEIDPVTVIDGIPVFLSRSTINQIVTDRLADADFELRKINETLANIEEGSGGILEQINALSEVKDLAFLGEALSRLNTVTKLDSQGIPVFDYKLEKQVRDIEFNMGMPIADFIAGEKPNDAFFRSRKEYMDPEKLETFMKRERSIRSYIDIPGVVNELPHIREYVKAIQGVNSWFESGFVKHSPMVKSAVKKFMTDKKIDWFQSEQAYYSFYKEFDSFLLATYFSSEFKSKTFQNASGYIIKEDINIGNPEGRYQFGMEFPGRIMSRLDELKSKGENELTEQDRSLKSNKFLNALSIRSMSTGDYLEIKNSYKMKDEDYADLRVDFKKLPKDLQEEFTVYQLIKDGFQFTQGGLYEAMDSKVFEGYSSFMSTIEEAADSFRMGEDPELRVINSDGDHVSMSFSAMMNNVFLKDVGYYSDDNSLLKRNTKNNERIWSMNPKFEPDQYIVEQKKGQFTINKVFDRNTQTFNEGRTSKNFNPYNVTESVLTPQQVLRRIDEQAYSDLKKGKAVTIQFNSKVDYDMNTPLFIRDGSKVKIISKDSKNNSITVVPDGRNNIMMNYQTTNNKRQLIRSISENTKNELHKNLAGFLLDNWSDSYMSIGSVTFSDKLNNSVFEKADEANRKVYGYFERGKMNIFINKSQANTQQLMERAILHETLHNLTQWSLDMTSKDLASLSPSERLVMDRALVFRSDINKIFTAAKAYAKANDFKANGLKDIHEFVADAFTNPEFQEMLKNVEAVDELKTENWLKTLWDTFSNALKNFFGIKTPNSYTALEQVIGVTNSFVQTKGYDITKLFKSSEGILYMEEFETPVVDINQTKDIINAIQPSGVMKNYSEYREEELVNAIFNNIDPVSQKYYYNGESFYFKDLDEMATKAKIKSEILPLFTEFENNYKSTVISWLNDGANEQGSIPEKYFPRTGGGSRYSGAVLAEIKRLIDYDVNDVYMRYSDFKEAGNSIPYIDQFEGYDPIIIQHRSLGEDKDAISIFDTTSLRLGTRGILEGNIFKNFVESDKKALRMGISLGNNEGDIRRMLLGFQAMAMKKANPDLQIKHIGVLGINNKGIDSTYVFMDSFVDTVNAIKEIPVLYESLSEEIRAVVDDSNLYKKESYDQPYIFMLKRKFEERMLDLRDIEGQSSWNFKKTNESIGKMESYLAGEGGKEHIIEIVRNRMHELDSKMDEDSVKSDREYQYLSATLYELTKTPTFEQLSTKDLNKFKSWYTPTSKIEHGIINWAQEKIRDGVMYVTEQVSQFQQNKFVPLLSEFNQRHFVSHPEDRMLDYTRDLSGKKFQKLFKTRTVKDQGGADIEINSMEIHWDINDSDTQKAVSAGILDKKDVELGKFIVESIEDQMLQNLMHNNRWAQGASKYTIDDAKKELASKWRKGMIPVMSSSVNEMLMKKDPKSVKAGFKKLINKIINPDDIYDEMNQSNAQSGKEETIIKEIGDFFMHQIGRDSDVYGSESRMRLMGLTNTLSGPVLIDDTTNKNMSTNLELITLYMLSSSTRKRWFDSKVLPSINAAQTMMKNAELLKLEGTQPNAIKYFTNYVNSVIKGKSITVDSKVGGLDVDATLGIALQVTTFNGLVLNPAVAAGSAIMNANQLFGAALSNDIAKNGMYGRKEAAQALQMLGTKAGRDKLEGIMEMFKVADRTERDMIHNPRRKITDKNVFTSYHAFWMNWLTDYSVRGVVAAAQMIKDGSIAAYSMKDGALVYDESNDPRWKKEYGDNMKKMIKERLIEQGYMTSMDEKMPRGLENKEANFLKTLADDYVVGSMDDATKTQLSRSTMGRPFMQFRSFLPNKIHRYFGSEKYATAEGKWTSKSNPEGKVDTVWEYNVASGIFTTFGSLLTELRKNNYKSFGSWSDVQAHDKSNLSKFAYDLVFGSALFMLYSGLTQIDWDDEEEGTQNMIEDSRFMRVLKYSAMDMFLFSPTELLRNIGTLPVLEQATRYANIAVGDFSQVEKGLPLYSTFSAFKEVMDDK